MSVQLLVEDIRKNLSQASSSTKDEVTVMVEMLNDKDYKVGEYTKAGKVGEYSPYEDSRKMVASIVNKTAKISMPEAKTLADSYQFGKSEATSMVNISKEFVNTYLQTGRKLPFGGRENMSASLLIKHVDESKKQFPIGGIGSKERGEVTIPAHDSVKVTAPCPIWVKNK